MRSKCAGKCKKKGELEAEKARFKISKIDLDDIKDGSGEHFDYELFFSCFSKKMRTRSDEKKREIEDKICKIIRDKERSYSVLECAIKTMHFLVPSLISPVLIENVIEKGNVLEIYCAHLIERIDREEGKRYEWDAFVRSLLYADRMVPQNFGSAIGVLCRFEGVEETLKRFLGCSDEQKLQKILRVAGMLAAGQKRLVEGSTERYAGYIGSRDGILSREASDFLKKYRRHADADFYRDAGEKEVLVEDAGHFIRDIFEHLPRAVQVEIREMLKKENPLENVLSLLPGVRLVSTQEHAIPRKIRAQIMDTELGEGGGHCDSPEDMYTIRMAEISEKDGAVDFSYLFSEIDAHYGCFEV